MPEGCGACALRAHDRAREVGAVKVNERVATGMTPIWQRRSVNDRGGQELIGMVSHNTLRTTIPACVALAKKQIP